MNYLVTGGAGFIGSRVVRDLSREGNKVVAYDLFPEGNVLDGVLSKEERANVSVVQGDVTDLAYLLQVARDNAVEKIIHLAYILHQGCLANATRGMKVNCEGTTNVFEAARLLGLKKVFWASSQAVFGAPEKHPGRIANDAPHYPNNIYGACKSWGERVADFYSERYGLDICAIRYTVVYGTGMDRSTRITFFNELVGNPALGKPGRAPFGDDTFNWLYVDEAARATVVAIKAPRTKTRAFNISGPIATVKEAADCVRKFIPGAKITLLPGRMASSYDFDTTPIEQEIGFRPKWTLEAGLKDLANTVRRQHGLAEI